MRISDWSSDVCSSDLHLARDLDLRLAGIVAVLGAWPARVHRHAAGLLLLVARHEPVRRPLPGVADHVVEAVAVWRIDRSEERRVGKGCGSTCRSRWSPDN